ncbi:MAG: hypothetical protein LBC84_10105 [Prevotellaceae bacterium]|jgi:hypothetical protein|nr:hypothetical protein [Prevotellaceae bacterium]
MIINPKIKLFLLAAMMTIAATACVEKIPDDNPDEPEIPEIPQKPTEPQGSMVSIILDGMVTDLDGNPISGVKVTTGTENVTTSSDGDFSLSKAEVVDNRVVVRFEKNDYFSLVRSCDKPEKEMFLEVVLCPKGNSNNTISTTFASLEGKTLELPSGLKIVLQPASIVRADGSPFSGTVYVEMRYLAPNMPDASLMRPGGDELGIASDGEEVLLSSFGMIGVELTDNAGNPLQLKENFPADVTFPVPEIIKERPASVPLWTFDKKRGIWIEEGTATLQGDVYKGKVKHFSDEDLAPIGGPTRLVSGVVVDYDLEPVKLATVRILWAEIDDDDLAPVGRPNYTGKEITTYTNSNGEYGAKVPKNTIIHVIATGRGGKDEWSGDPMLINGKYSFQALTLPNVPERAKTGAVHLPSDNGREDYYVTWDEWGLLYRTDRIYDDRESPDGKGYEAQIINHLTEIVYDGAKYWTSDGEGGGSWKEEWQTVSYPCPGGLYHTPEVILGAFTVNEKEWEPYRQKYTKTVAGRKCAVFKVGGIYTMASWNGILMSRGTPYDVPYNLVRATMDVPQSAFNQIFNPSWIR